MKNFKLLFISTFVVAVSMSNVVRAEELTKKTCQQLYHQINQELVKTKVTDAERAKAIKLRNKGLTECKQGKLEASMKNLQESWNIIMQIQPSILPFLF